MRRYNQKMVTWILAGAVVLMAGCTEVARPPQPTASGQGSDPDILKRFQQTLPDHGQTPVDSAIELSNKYAALSEEAAKLRLERQSLIAENTQHKERMAAMVQELAQTKKELAQANDLLIEMRIELNNWKADVLGFRDEMRQADKVQIQTLIKILEALGGEVKDIVPLPDSASDVEK